MKEDAFGAGLYLKSQDCYFYFYSTCLKGDACPFRHEAAARENEVVCRYWAQGSCTKQNCPYRHMEITKPKKSVNCYWETQPSGCLKAHCPFLHTKDRSELLAGIDNPGISGTAQTQTPSPSTEETTTEQVVFPANQNPSVRGEYPLPRKDLRNKTIIDTLRKKHLLEQQLYVLQMKQKAAEELEARKKQLGLPSRQSAEKGDEMVDEYGILSPTHWRLSGEVGSSGGSPVSASPIHVSPAQAFVLNLADDDSDSDMDASFSRGRETNAVKSIDEIRLQKVQAEQESLMSYGSFGRPATVPAQPATVPKPVASGDLREKLLRSQQQKFVKEDAKKVKEEVRIKTLEEIRAERAMKEQGKGTKIGQIEERIRLKRQVPLEGGENVKRMRRLDERNDHIEVEKKGLHTRITKPNKITMNHLVDLTTVNNSASRSSNLSQITNASFQSCTLEQISMPLKIDNSVTCEVLDRNLLNSKDSPRISTESIKKISGCDALKAGDRNFPKSGTNGLTLVNDKFSKQIKNDSDHSKLESTNSVNFRIHEVSSHEFSKGVNKEGDLLNTSGESEEVPGGKEKSNNMTAMIDDQETSLCKTEQMECERGGGDYKNLTEGNDVGFQDEFDALFPD